MIKVNILTDDRVRKRNLVAEHGLSLWIQRDDKYILFDTGQSSIFRHNAKVMGIDIELADYIVISHGHYDHCGGLRYWPQRDLVNGIFVHPDAFLEKLAPTDGDEPCREVGIPFKTSTLPWLKDRIIYNNQPTELAPGILVSGEIPRINSFEDTPKNFYIKKNGKVSRDIIRDEQMLILEDNGELAIFLGCSHPGVVNSIEYARQLMPGLDIKLLVAGMHLDGVSHERLRNTIEYLVDMDIENIVPLHCTGFKAMCEIKRVFEDRCHLLCVGDSIEK